MPVECGSDAHPLKHAVEGPESHFASVEQITEAASDNRNLLGGERALFTEIRPEQILVQDSAVNLSGVTEDVFGLGRSVLGNKPPGRLLQEVEGWQGRKDGQKDSQL